MYIYYMTKGVYYITFTHRIFHKFWWIELHGVECCWMVPGTVSEEDE